MASRSNVDIVLDCTEPGLLARFWAAALGYRIAGSKEEYVALVPEDRTHPPLVLQRVPEPKGAKNRMHLDIITETSRRRRYVSRNWVPGVSSPSHRRRTGS